MKRILKISPYLILLLGLALRLYRLGANSLWYDETVSLLLARSAIPELIRHTAGDIHPPLYYLLLHFWGRLTGWSEFSAAFLSLWFGALLIALVYRVARAWLPTRAAALLAAFLVAVSPYNIWYSQEVRMYTIGATLGLLSIYFLRRMLAQPKIFSRDFFAYVIFTALGLYALYYFVFLMVFEWLWVAYRVWRMADSRRQMADGEWQSASRKLITDCRLLITDYRSLITFLLSQLALVLLYLPWLPIAFRQATDPPVPPWREFVALPRVLLETWSALTLGQSVDPFLFAPLTLLLLVPIGWILLQDRRTRQTTHSELENRKSKIENSVSPWFLFGYTFIPLAAIYLFSLWKPLYHVRYMFTYSPAFYMLGAYALVTWLIEFQNARRANAARWRYGMGALAMLMGIGFFFVAGYSLYNFWHNPQYAKDDLRGAVNYVAERWRPGDVILVNAGYAYPALAHYFPEAVTRERLVKLPVLNSVKDETSNVNAPTVLMTGSIGGAKNLGWGDPQSDFYATTAEETRAALDRVLKNSARVWMLRIYDTVVDPNGVIRDYFNTHTIMFDDQAFGGESQTRVQGFMVQPSRQIVSSATQVNQVLGERVELAGYEMRARELTRGGFLDVALYWKLLQAVNYNYQVTLQLLNGNGENVTQVDEMPLSEFLPMTRWSVNELYREPLRLKISPTLAPGAYRAIVKLYNPRSGEVLGEIIDLGGVQIR